MKLKILFSLIVVSLFLSGQGFAQCQLTLQPDSANSKDVHVFSLDCSSAYAQSGGGCDTTNFAGAWWARASAWTYGGVQGNYRTFIEFNLDSLISAGCTVNSAVFTLSPDGSSITNSGQNAFNISRVTQPWLESTMTWVTQPTVAVVDSGIDYVTIAQDADPFKTYTIDLTDMVNYWLTNPGSNKGFMISLVAEIYYSRVVVGLSENTDPTLRPKLLLDLNCPGACSNLLSGYIYDDANADCVQDSGETGLANWLVEILPGPMYANTDSNGYYEAVGSNANYTVSQIIPNNHLWDSICPINPNSYAVTGLTGMDTVSNLHFAVQADVYCPDLTVDIGANFLRECHNEVYRVSYCNNGNVAASNVFIEVDFDSKLVPGSATIAWDLPQSGTVYTFQLGTLDPGACGVFAINAMVACDVVFGGVYCVEAQILPEFTCLAQQDSTWDKSSLMVEGVCAADSAACFSIYNTGDPGNGDMGGPSEYRIYENGVLVFTGGVIIAGGDSTLICWPASGNTIRLEVDQRPGHPGKSHPNATVENCDSTFIPKLGFQLGFSLDDDDHHVAIDCEEVRSSWDPNDKAVTPRGLYTEGYISEFDNLDYKIRFQNTGNDTAFKVVITDTLPSTLDIRTIQLGASSHKYTFRILGSGILQWTFDNILLPDSNINEPQSHGFVKFKVDQVTGNVIGTEIRNEVGIYFDYNPVVVTNLTLNTVGEMDSVTAAPITFAYITQSACGSYTAPSGNQSFTTSGTYIDTIPNVFGGDSILTINLTILNSTSSTLNETSCSSYTVPSGDETYTTTGTYQDTLPNLAGCDSIITINLQIHGLPTVEFVNLSTDYCTLDDLINLAGNPPGGTFSGTGVGVNLFDPGLAGIGTHTLTYTYTDLNNCTNYISKDVNVDTCTTSMTLEEAAIVYGLSLFPNPNTGIFILKFSIKDHQQITVTITNTLGQEVYLESLPEFSGPFEKQIDLSENGSGIYSLQLVTPTGTITKQVILK